MTRAFHHDTLRALGKRRIVIDRHRHRDRKTKARQTFPGTGRGITTRTAIARVDVCTPVAALLSPRVTIPDPCLKPPDMEPGRPPGATAGPHPCPSRSATTTPDDHASPRTALRIPITLKSMALGWGDSIGTAA